MRTPRNDFLDCDCTDDAREFVRVASVPEIAESLVSLERLVVIQCSSKGEFCRG